MKNIKNYILVASFTYIAIIVFLIINLFIFRRPYFKFTTSEKINGKFDEISNEINNISDEQCKNSLIDFMDSSVNDGLNGKVRVRKLYDYILSENIIKYYSSINKSCNITEEELEKYDISSKFIIKLSLYDKLILTYFNQYELGFMDEATLDVYTRTNQMAYDSLKYNDIEMSLRTFSSQTHSDGFFALNSSLPLSLRVAC
jgi:hypothetical protein